MSKQPASEHVFRQYLSWSKSLGQKGKKKKNENVTFTKSLGQKGNKEEKWKRDFYLDGGVGGVVHHSWGESIEAEKG